MNPITCGEARKVNPHKTEILAASSLTALIALLVCVALTALASNALAAADSPSVSGPIPGTPTISEFQDLAQVGYDQAEFFLSGMAHSYTPTIPLTLAQNGKWTVAADLTTAAYETRVVVDRPIDSRRFNGAVWLEWLNVSGGLDAGPDWTLAHNEAVREGAVWIGVSAQAVGVNALKTFGNPARYASLSHPGDSYSYDIFSQAGQAVRDSAALLLSGLSPQRVLAIGESQSAIRLSTYIDAVHPLVNVYDGFLVHSRFTAGADLQQPPLTSIPVPSPTVTRDDLSVPVLVFETETDIFFSNDTVNQPDTDKYRLWEVAGTSHFDYYGLVIGTHDIGNGQGAVLALESMQHPIAAPLPGVIECTLPINTGPMHWVLDAAVFWLNAWVKDGTPPPIAPRFQITSVSPVVYTSDADGNTLGGIRTPQVDAPLAKLTGTGNPVIPTKPATFFCGLFGLTIPFTPAQLAAHYKNHGQFVSLWGQAAQDEVKAGFLLPPDALELKNAAAQSHIGK
ncbi:MAG TPA: alpha/beta hydrolase domain-containing protein [Candidatus Binataceae bacterium]|nr:alpha/beta hydrolase domain-containing protein [Candidatus Binataceae bacterium]